MFRTIVFTVLAISSSVVVGQITAPVEKPDVNVGDTWYYRSIDGFTNEVRSENRFRVVEITPTEITVQAESKGRSFKKQMISDRQWNTLDDGDAKYEPSNLDFQFPMSVGSTWKQQSQKTIFSSGAAFSHFREGKVVGTEKVTVPAGTFDTLRVESKTESRSLGPAATITNTVVTLWYAPQVNRWVRLTVQGSANGRVREKYSMELVDYTPAKRLQ